MVNSRIFVNFRRAAPSHGSAQFIFSETRKARYGGGRKGVHGREILLGKLN
jgi:hypothetical protein